MADQAMGVGIWLVEGIERAGTPMCSEVQDNNELING